MTSNSNAPEESAPSDESVKFDPAMVKLSVAKVRQMGWSWEKIARATGRTIEWLKATQSDDD